MHEHLRTFREKKTTKNWFQFYAFFFYASSHICKTCVGRTSSVAPLQRLVEQGNLENPNALTGGGFTAALQCLELSHGRPLCCPSHRALSKVPYARHRYSSCEDDSLMASFVKATLLETVKRFDLEVHPSVHLSTPLGFPFDPSIFEVPHGRCLP